MATELDDGRQAAAKCAAKIFRSWPHQSVMRLLPTNRHWSGWLLFPFRAYLIIAPVCLYLCSFAPETHKAKGAFAGAAAVVLFGCGICFLVFLLAAVILFLTHRRELIAETVLFAAIAFGISLLIAPLAAVS